MNNLSIQWEQIRKASRYYLLRNKNFSIISNNCWGGFIYQYFNMQYQSPFIGLFIFAPDYIKLIEKLNQYLELDLIFIKPENSRYKKQLQEYRTLNTYPIGCLNDIEIHFLHYKTEKIALDNWHRRLLRINYDNLIFKICDRDLCTPEIIEKFDSLKLQRKICLTAKKYNLSSTLKLKNEDGECIKDEWTNFKKTINPLICVNRLLSFRSLEN